jgi:phenylacetate-CoA ligase
LPVLEKVWGRLDDELLTKDGRRVVQIDRIFDPPLGIRAGQIIQKSLDEFCVRVVPDNRWSASDEEKLKQSLINIVGDVQVKVQTVNDIERTWAGKSRVIISELQKQDPQG